MHYIETSDWSWKRVTSQNLISHFLHSCIGQTNCFLVAYYYNQIILCHRKLDTQFYWKYNQSSHTSQSQSHPVIGNTTSRAVPASHRVTQQCSHELFHLRQGPLVSDHFNFIITWLQFNATQSKLLITIYQYLSYATQYSDWLTRQVLLR